MDAEMPSVYNLLSYRSRIGIKDVGLKPLCPPVYKILQYSNLLNSSDSHFCFRFR